VGLRPGGFAELRGVGHGVVAVAVDGAFDVDRIDFGAERVVEHVEHLVDGGGLLGADVVDACQLFVGELAGAGDPRDVGRGPGRCITDTPPLRVKPIDRPPISWVRSPGATHHRFA
jgi:hypothetical protein